MEYVVGDSDFGGDFVRGVNSLPEGIVRRVWDLEGLRRKVEKDAKKVKGKFLVYEKEDIDDIINRYYSGKGGKTYNSEDGRIDNVAWQLRQIFPSAVKVSYKTKEIFIDKAKVEG